MGTKKKYSAWKILDLLQPSTPMTVELWKIIAYGCGLELTPRSVEVNRGDLRPDDRALVVSKNRAYPSTIHPVSWWASEILKVLCMGSCFHIYLESISIRATTQHQTKWLTYLSSITGHDRCSNPNRVRAIFKALKRREEFFLSEIASPHSEWEPPSKRRILRHWIKDPWLSSAFFGSQSLCNSYEIRHLISF